MGSIRNKNNWNNPSKRLFGSYSYSGIPGFSFRLFYSWEQNSWNIFQNIFLFRNIPNERALNTTQLFDEVFVISSKFKVEVRVITQSRRPRLITLTETLIILELLPKPHPIMGLLYIERKTKWKSCFCSFTDEKRANLTWLAVTLGVLGMIIV